MFGNISQEEARFSANSDTVPGHTRERQWLAHCSLLKLSLCLTNWALRHEDVWGSGCIDPRFLERGTSWWVVRRPGRFTPGERVLGTHCIGDWVNPRAGLDDMEKWKFLTLPELKLRRPGRLARSQSLYRLRYPGSYISLFQYTRIIWSVIICMYIGHSVFITCTLLQV
jgi:hypothetical protein